MTLIGSVSPLTTTTPAAVPPPLPPRPTPTAPATDGVAPAADFPSMVDALVSGVEAKQAEAAAVTREVLLGQNPNLHQSMLAMQEASLSFSLMVEVRNKVLESYQELMRMTV